MNKTVKAVAKRTKKEVVSVKEFVAGQLALQDTWDVVNCTTTTRVVLVQSIGHISRWGVDAVVVLDNGSLAIVGVKTLRHLPEAFKNATI